MQQFSSRVDTSIRFGVGLRLPNISKKSLGGTVSTTELVALNFKKGSEVTIAIGPSIDSVELGMAVKSTVE